MTWTVILHALGSAWRWTKMNAGWLLLMTLGAVTGAKLLRRKDSEVQSVKEALEVQKHKAAIENLKGRREEVLKQEAETARADREIQQKAAVLALDIAERKRRIAALHDKKLDVEAMTNSEVEEYFRNAGL